MWYRSLHMKRPPKVLNVKGGRFEITVKMRKTDTLFNHFTFYLEGIYPAGRNLYP